MSIYTIWELIGNNLIILSQNLISILHIILITLIYKFK